MQDVISLRSWRPGQKCRQLCCAPLQVCWMWAACSNLQGLASLAVHTLRPKVSLVTQWHVLHLLSKDFSACNILDLRSLRVPQNSGQHLQDTAFTQIHLSNVKAGCKDQTIQEPHEHIACACCHRPSLCFSINIGVQNPTIDTFSDKFCLALLQLPRWACTANVDADTSPAPVIHREFSYIADMTMFS